MSTAFSIERPSVIATLPRPIDRSTGRYVVSDVHGGTPGSRKRKRSELAVGIDGEGLNIYDTKSSKLITSYALPPQSSFACSPCSVRRKSAKHGVERRTYVSTEDKASSITLFQDITTFGATTKSTIITKKLEGENNPLVFLAALSKPVKGNEESLIIVRKNGEIQCFDGTNLDPQWTSPCTTIAKNTTMPDITGHRVMFAQITDAHTATKTLFRGREDVLSAFSHDETVDRTHSSLLVLITSPAERVLWSNRTLHVIALPSKLERIQNRTMQSVKPMLSMALPWLYQVQPEEAGEVVYKVHIASGVLYELVNHTLTSFDISDSLPKVRSQVYVDGATSFLPLSSNSIVTASAEYINIYHLRFQSIQASTSLKAALQPIARKRKNEDEEVVIGLVPCKLVSYLPKQSIVYALLGNDLLRFQIEAPRNTPGRQRAFGLLLDSLGCGVPQSSNVPFGKLKRIPLKSLGSYMPGSEPINDRAKEDKILDMDRYVMAQDVEAFEYLMVKELGLSRDEEELNRWKNKQKLNTRANGLPVTNGINGESHDSSTQELKPIPPWLWPNKKAEYPDVDPGWVQYALSRIFTWSKTSNSSKGDVLGKLQDGQLKIMFFPHNVVNWLIETGNFNRASIQSALRHELLAYGARMIPSGQLVEALLEVDLDFKSLLSLLSSTYLDAVELLCAIRALMQSLEMFGESHLVNQLLLTNGDTAVNDENDMDVDIELEEEQADKALKLAEAHLGDFSSIRGQALSLALSKLHSCPASAVISALRANFASDEVVSLIYLLRFELARGAWTSRYLDTYQPEGDDEDTGHENTIILISDLLNCCVDAIGAGGWLSGQAMLLNDDHFESEELIASLKLEVSAALEGIQEASFLKGLTSEMVRFGEAVQNGRPDHEKRRKTGGERRYDGRPITLPETGRDAFMLPFGLKAEQQISLYRIGAGGEIQLRSMRDIGNLKSKKVGKYSRERIVI